MDRDSEQLVKKVKSFVEEECRKPGSNYGYGPFEHHFKPTVKYAQELAEELDADKEIVTIAAWLHDIGSIKHGREDHHETGAKIAGKKLKELGYPEEKRKKVKECIRNHRSSVDNNRETIEEKIVAEADALSSFDDVTGQFQAAFVHEGLDREEARRSVSNKLQRKWNQLHFPESREMVKPKYEAAMKLFN